MTIDYKDEYGTLRQEMLERFDRIHDSMKYGTGAFIAFLSYYYATSEFSNYIALIILQLLVSLIGVCSLRHYQSIYRTGTYVAIIIEENSEAKWHRMSRQLDSYWKSINKDKWTCDLPFPLGKRWGADSTMLAILLIILAIIGGVTVALRVESLPAFQSLQVFHWICLLLIGFLLINNVIIIYQLSWGMRKFMDNEVEAWKKYSLSFGNDFADRYSERKPQFTKGKE